MNNPEIKAGFWGLLYYLRILNWLILITRKKKHSIKKVFLLLMTNNECKFNSIILFVAHKHCLIYKQLNNLFRRRDQ